MVKKNAVVRRFVVAMENESKNLKEEAQALMQEERWSDAINLIESRPALFEKDAELSWNLGWAYFKLEDWKSAQAHLSRARDLDRNRAASWWALAAAQMEDGVLDKAERNAKEALRIRDSSLIRQMLALILMRRGRLGEAEQVHLRGLELKPESPDRWETYACFLDDLGRQNDAEVAYKKARFYRGN
ncbi:MAG TPA: tetratricopeptide repeat protein [Blastocatellia bacterium]|nr:tetratricopeptide repeat protein [Blastocatellia bacterium]